MSTKSAVSQGDLDKDIERSRYDNRAAAMMMSISSEQEIPHRAFGAEAIPLPLREPYIEYEARVQRWADSSCSILELCAGSGLHSKKLLETGARVVATDISQNSLEFLKKSLGRYNGRLVTQTADMEALPFGDATFDMVVCAGGLSYGDNDIVLSEIVRVLKSNGKFICVDSLNNNPIYRLNRWLAYKMGKRSKSTLLRMPALETINKYKNSFNKVEVAFFGSLTWMAPLLTRVVGERRTALLIRWFDQWIGVKGSAFKFVMTAYK
ncbi:MAG: class I SAM-dependent methyltransferase [Magnetococcales bacterium]|nr:class I SAM-dependent methyltransferase [Magnetococcales bacterium]NGZ29266.1 class I SAM-dependent methyltransferase [Magnetococcales bacterium]